MLLARETPLTQAYLRNMLTVTDMGGIIAPPVPAFYARPETLDDLIDHTLGRVLDLFGLDADPSHQHDPRVTSVGIELPGHIDLTAMSRWVEELRSTQDDDLFRVKGIFSVENDAFSYVMQGVHKYIDFQPAHPWGRAERSNKIVFIGRNLDREALNSRFAQCMAA